MSFDMPKWAGYLEEWCTNAELEGADVNDLIALLNVKIGLLNVRAKAQILFLEKWTPEDRDGR